jgi:hypothetical protein
MYYFLHRLGVGTLWTKDTEFTQYTEAKYVCCGGGGGGGGSSSSSSNIIIPLNTVMSMRVP